MPPAGDREDVLVLHAGATEVSAQVVSPDGSVIGAGHQPFASSSPRPGWVEHAAEEVWQAALAAVRAALATYDPSHEPSHEPRHEPRRLRAVQLVTHPDLVAVWDQETLGSPRPLLGAGDERAGELCDRLRGAGHEPRIVELSGLALDPRLTGPRLAWVAEHEPHTWALVASGRYGVGGLEAYLVARMTRGLDHLTTPAHAARTQLLDVTDGGWSAELCTVFDVPPDALPELVTGPGDLALTDPSTFLGLELPLTSLAVSRG